MKGLAAAWLWDLISSLSLGLVAFLIGFVGGMVGLVLGVLRLPVIYLYGLKPAMAAGTNIGISSMGALAGSASHVRGGRVDWRVVLTMSPAAALGAFVGGYYSWISPPWIILTMVGLIILYEGLSLSRTPKPLATGPYSLTVAEEVKASTLRVAKEVAIAFSIGVLGGMVGLVLGSLRIVAMIRLLNMDPKKAAGSNLAISSIKGVAGFLSHLTFGQVSFSILLSMGVAAMAGGYAGAKFTGKLEGWKLKRVLGYILLTISSALFWGAYISAS